MLDQQQQLATMDDDETASKRPKIDQSSDQQPSSMQTTAAPSEPSSIFSLTVYQDPDFQRLHSLSSSTTGVDGEPSPSSPNQSSSSNCSNQPPASPKPVIESTQTTKINEEETPKNIVELRFLVRRREAGALIGKRGSNIKRLRETFKTSMFSIPDTGNGPERVVCIATNQSALDRILTDITSLMMEKSPANDDQIELKLLIHSSRAGSIIGVGGQSIKRLRNDSKAAIKIYEMCCPLSSERVCAIKARPPVVVNTIKLLQSIMDENPIKGTVKPYDALHFDLNLVDKYGGFLPDESVSSSSAAAAMAAAVASDPLLAAAAAANHRLFDQIAYGRAAAMAATCGFSPDKLDCDQQNQTTAPAMINQQQQQRVPSRFHPYAQLDFAYNATRIMPRDRFQSDRMALYASSPGGGGGGAAIRFAPGSHSSIHQQAARMAAALRQSDVVCRQQHARQCSCQTSDKANSSNSMQSDDGNLSSAGHHNNNCNNQNHNNFTNSTKSTPNQQQQLTRNCNASYASSKSATKK